ncbi:MAG: hypothetical protein ABW076_03265 [Candidatus Thiodiazotropha sp.]
MDYRVILYHKQPTSARTRFLKFSHESVCAFEALPKLSARVTTLPSTVHHPAAILRETETRLGFPRESLSNEAEYRQGVEVPGETIEVLLASINTIDPPFETAEQIDACFIDLTQARKLPQVELELLRAAYELILGG